MGSDEWWQEQFATAGKCQQLDGAEVGDSHSVDDDGPHLTNNSIYHLSSI